MHNFWRIKVTLEKGQQVILPDVRSENPGWMDSALVGIQSIEFPFILKVNNDQTKSVITIANMEAYNFFVEASKVPGGPTNINALWFMGKLPKVDKVVGFAVQRCGVAKIEQPFGKEYRGIATYGWKPGTGSRNGSPIFKVEYI